LIMKAKRIVLIICTVLIAALLGVSLTSCLKIGMRTSPMTSEGQSGYKIGDILHGTMIVRENVDGEDVEKEESVFVFFTGDTRSADWVQERCKKYVEENVDNISRWNVYRFEEVVVVGYYKLVSIVRQY